MLRLEYTIPDKWRGEVISHILKRELRFSSGLLRTIKADPAALRLDGEPVPHYRTPGPARVLSVALPEDPPSPIAPVPGTLELLYEDEHLLVLNKAPGVIVHPGSGHHGNTLGNFVTWHYQQHGESHLFRPVNRLDKGTSGVMCVAKHGYAADLLRLALHSGAFSRTYLALCEGVFARESGTVDAPIGRREGSVVERQVRADGKPAVTHYRVLRVFNGRTLVEAVPETGRTHQIRVHMAHLGHPLTGDFLYGTEQPGLIRRPALHSHRMRLRHPVTGAALEFTAPLPEDMARLCRI